MRNNHPIRVIALSLGIGLCGVTPAFAANESLSIFVAPNGDDNSDGSSVAKPLKTLGKALRLYETNCASRPTHVVLAAGAYGDEKNVLKKVPCPLSVEASAAGRPSFDGKGSGTWLGLDAPGAKQVDVSISGMEITNYQSAISINGNRNDPEGWIGGVRILKNRFVRIGSFREDQPPATAAVRLVNARSVLIEANEFQTIRNASHCGGLHSVYIAHMSSDNRVIGNRFVDGCGETIKARDSSNRNVVEKNRFENQEGSALFLDSYCDASAGAECTKAEAECPSWDNVFRDNTIVGPRPALNKKIVNARRAGPVLPANCAVSKSPAGRVREERTLSR